MIRPAPTLCALAFLSACGPMSLPDAERACLSDARLAQHPRGWVAVGVGSGGRTGAGFSMDISSDYLLGRDPDAVYATCVQQRAGQPPSRPFTSLPESRTW
ncbi:MAG: hypothetical protein ACOH2H_16595 [Cypionkella sp.]